MVIESVSISYEEFIETYKPIINHSYAPFDGYLFETYGKDVQTVIRHIKEKNNNYCWTLLDVDNGESYIIPGYHYVYRQGYFVTKVPWTNENLEVDLNDYVIKNTAINACFDFWASQNFIFDRDTITKYYPNEKYSVGEAKYIAIELFEDIVGNEISEKQADDIHDYYSQLF